MLEAIGRVVIRRVVLVCAADRLFEGKTVIVIVIL
jgi:hypothetical protein